MDKKVVPKNEGQRCLFFYFVFFAGNSDILSEVKEYESCFLDWQFIVKKRYDCSILKASDTETSGDRNFHIILSSLGKDELWCIEQWVKCCEYFKLAHSEQVFYLKNLPLTLGLLVSKRSF